MAEKKIVVPEEMLNYVTEHVGVFGETADGTRRQLEAALRWLNGALETQRLYAVSDWKKGYNAAIDDLRRMFFVSEPEVPEAVRDLVEGMSWGTTTPHAILEAYRRGKEGR